MKDEAIFIFRLDDQTEQPLSQINAHLDTTAQHLDEIGKANRHLEDLRKYALGAGLAVGAGLGAAAKYALDLKNQMAPVQTLLTGTAAEVQNASDVIAKSAVHWSTQHKDSIADYLSGVYNAISAGLEWSAAIAATEQAMILANATLGEASQATELLTGLYNNLGDKTANAQTEMTRLADIAAKTQQLFAIKNLDQLASGFAKAAAGANTYGVDVVQTAAAVGQLNTAMIKGPEAGTAFNAMLAMLGKASGDLGFDIARAADGTLNLVQTIANIKATGASGDVLQQAFGQEGLKAVSALIKNFDALQANTLQVANSLGTAAEASAKRAATPAQQMATALNKLVAVGVKIGGSLAPAVMGLAGALSAALDFANWLLDIFPPLGVVIAVAGTALAAFLLAFGAYAVYAKTAATMQAFLNLNLWRGIIAMAVAKAAALAAGIQMHASWLLALGPLGALIATIEIAAVVIAALAPNIGGIIQWWNGLTESIRGTNPVLDGLIWLIDQALGGIKQLVDWFKQLFNLGKSPSDAGIPDIPAEKALSEAAKPSGAAKLPKVSKNIASNETDWGMNAEFLAANGLGGGVRPSAKTIDTVRAGVQNVTHNKGGAVDNSRSIHIANVTIDGANITDFETFKLELSAAVGSLA